MKLPPLLKEGSLVALVASSFAPTTEAVGNCIAFYEELGCRVKLFYDPAEHYFQFAATDEQRAAHLYNALEDPEVEAIQFIRGGYGITRLLQLQSLASALEQNPKWLIGFSDVTAILSYVCRFTKIAAVHGPMGSHLVPENPGAKALARLLTEGYYKVTMPCESSAEIDITAPIVGGNATMMAHLLGGQWLVNFSNSILFLEETNEHYYHLDRLMLQLSNHTDWSGPPLFILGGHFTGMKGGVEEIGADVVDILARNFQVASIAGFPTGHDLPNYPVPLGINMHLKVSNGQLSLSLPNQTI